jgi:2-dehydro-3-deoxyglucarate aldolase/4-hydroxy-2-oxoheptanedioate aldolase
MPESIITSNKIKQALKNGQSVVGTMVVEIRQPAVMQLLANAGFDFVIIDNEHGPFNIETIAELSRAAIYAGLTPVVRIPDLAYPHVAQPLDSGAQGIMQPRVYDATQVRQAVEMMKYPPLGKRGSALSRGYTKFRSGSTAEAMEAVNQETILFVQIETREALDNIDEILAIPGVDVAFVGPNDLSIALGVPGQLDAPEMREALDEVIAACARHNKYPALHVNDLDLAVKWARKGMRILTGMSEAGLMVQRGVEVSNTIRDAFAK